MNLKAVIKARADKATLFNQRRAVYNAFVAKTSGANALALSAEEQTQADALETELDALETDIAALDAQIAKAEKAARWDALSSSTSITSANGNTTGARISILRAEPNPQTSFGFNAFTEFARAVAHANINVDPRLAGPPGNTMITQGGAGEGFLVPPDFSRGVWDLVFPGYGYDLMDLITPTQTESNMIQLVKDETTPWGASGVQAVWRSEAGQLNASKLSMTGATVPLHELYAFCAATQEIQSDAPQLQDRLTVKAAMAIRFAVSKAIFQGDGVNKPLGWANSPAIITQAKESGQTAGTIVLNNVVKMLTRIPAGSLPKTIWLANIEILPQLVNLNVGTWPVWVPANAGAAQAPGGYLFGRPIVFTEQALALGTPGDLTLVDPTGYFLATKVGGGLDFAASIHLFFDYNVTAFRWIFRVGGQPLLSAPITPANGALTKSHMVNLQAR